MIFASHCHPMAMEMYEHTVCAARASVCVFALTCMFVHVCTIRMYEHAHAYALMWTCPRTYTIHTCMTAPRACWCDMIVYAGISTHAHECAHACGWVRTRA